MNSATDPLFGDSTAGAGFTFGDEFELAFGRCINEVGGAGQVMRFGASKDLQYERDVKFIHGNTHMVSFPFYSNLACTPDSIDIRMEQVLSQLR